MAFENLVPLIVFAGVLVFTPGPANMLLMSAGANAGLRASLPLVAGVVFGKIFVHLSLALGLWQAVERFPRLLLFMKVLGAIYILWLAWKILQIKIKSASAPAGFGAGLIVHPLNPKAWAMVVSAYGQFIEAQHNWWAQTLIIALVFLFWQCVAHTLWCWSGARAARLLAGTVMEKYLLGGLAALMVGAVGWSLLY